MKMSWEENIDHCKRSRISQISPDQYEFVFSKIVLFAPFAYFAPWFRFGETNELIFTF